MHAKTYQFITYIIYSIIAGIVSKYLNVHWIHVLNALILSAILYQILEWRYDWVEEDNDKMEETT